MTKVEIYYDGELYAAFDSEEWWEEFVAIGLVSQLFLVSTKPFNTSDEV